MNARLLFSAVLAAALLLTLSASAQDTTANGDAPVLAVPEIGFGADFDYAERQLTGESTTFPAGIEKIWCRTRITGAAEPTTVTHVWYRDGKTMARVDLAVSSPDFRTASSKRLLPDWTGAWEVKVLDAEGTVLGSAAFTVE
jgi:hypothetical protein